MPAWRLTIRHGPEVRRHSFASPEEAVGELERRAEEIRRGGALEQVTMLRTFEPTQRVKARLEVSGPGLIRSPEAGVDVMGDGTLVPYRGAMFKKRLEPGEGETPYDAVREALGG